MHALLFVTPFVVVGSTSVLADIYMNDSHPSIEAELFSLQFGFVLQLVDDIQVGYPFDWLVDFLISSVLIGWVVDWLGR